MTLIDYSSSALSVLPAVIALVLAIITRRVFLSLGLGIITGAIMLTNGNIIHSTQYIFAKVLSLIYQDNAIHWNNINIIIFLLLLSVLTALLSESGSNQAFANWASKHIKTRRGAKLMTASLVFITFIDDYFHSLAVGAIARPVIEKYKISKTKLAYILDSTAAPMCVLMPVSSWGAYIITLISGLLATYAITTYTPIGAFMLMSSMNYYALFSLIMVFFVASTSFNIGAMRRYELTARREKTVVVAEENTRGHVRNLILPIATLLIGTVISIIVTGAEALSAEGKPFSILGAFENTIVGLSLVIGGGSAVAIAILCISIDNLIPLPKYFTSTITGLKAMSGAILILIFAWTINAVVKDMETGKYLSKLVSGSLSFALLPALLFILSTLMAFCTGTSWGTFGIMLPIAASIAHNASIELIIPCMSTVMAGAVCGDHCSPISDTTILSSTGAECNHMAHVITQIPYASIVAISTLIGYLSIGFSICNYQLSLGLASLYGFICTSCSMIIIIWILSHHRHKHKKLKPA